MDNLEALRSRRETITASGGCLLGGPGLVFAYSTPHVTRASFLDDRYSISPGYRIVAHVLAAVMILYGGFYLQTLEIPGTSWQWPYAVAAVFSVLYTAWMINLYNFMDGSNGLAGGMALFGFAAYGIAALIAHADTLAMLNFSISAAALGILFFNFHPVRVFMGDAGSIPLGFLAAAMGLWGWQQDCWAAWFPLLVFSPYHRGCKHHAAEA